MLLLDGFFMYTIVQVLQGGDTKSCGQDEQGPGTVVHPLKELVAPFTSSAGDYS